MVERELSARAGIRGDLQRRSIAVASARQPAIARLLRSTLFRLQQCHLAEAPNQGRQQLRDFCPHRAATNGTSMDVHEDAR